MFLFYVLSFFKKGDTIQGGTLFKGGHYSRKYGKCEQGLVWVMQGNSLNMTNFLFTAYISKNQYILHIWHSNKQRLPAGCRLKQPDAARTLTGPPVSTYYYCMRVPLKEYICLKSYMDLVILVLKICPKNYQIPNFQCVLAS